MQMLRRGWELSKTIKNVGRLKEIVSVLARNGFDELIWKSGIVDKIPHFVLPKSERPVEEDKVESEDWWRIIGGRLRQSFEELGPTFVKLGQLLSSREDLFPDSFIEEMKVLLDQVKGIPFGEGQLLLEKELRRPISEVFKSINPVPLGTASIGIVYAGELVTGDPVVIKLQRPSIKSVIQIDITILRFLVKRLEKVSDEIKYLGISRLVNDFEKSIVSELDFNIECLNAGKLSKNLEIIDKSNIFYIPKFYPEYCSEKVLVMERLEGIPFSRVEQINEFRDVVEKRFLEGSKVFIDSLFKDGFFHADLHGGNFFLLPNNKIGIIDFGLVGSLGIKERKNLVAILYCLVNNNFENLVYEFLEVAEYDKVPDIEALVYDMRSCLLPYLGPSFQKMNFSKLVGQITKTLASHQIYLPREWFTLLRALVALEGVGRSLNWDFDLVALLQENVDKQIKDLFSKDRLWEEWMWGGRDLLSLVRLIPRHLRWILRDFTKKNYAIEISIKGLQKDFQTVSRSIHFMAYAFVSGMALLSGALIAKGELGESQQIPSMAISLWVFSFLLFSWGWWKSR